MTAAALDPTFRALADGVADLVLRFDVHQRLLYANRTYEQVSGRRGAEMIGRELHELGLAPESAVRLRAAIDAVLGGAGESTVRHACTVGDGSTRWFESRFIPERDADGVTHAVLCVSRDVSDEIAAEDALRVKEAHFELLYQAAPVGIGRTTLDGRWLDANPRLCAMLGYTVDELRRMTSAELSAPGDAVLYGAELLARGDGDHQAVKRYRRKDGSLLWVSVSVRVARDAAGRPLHLVGIAEDVSERVSADRALRESEARFRALVEQSPLSTIVYDPDGRPLEANAAFERLWGITLDQLPPGYTVFDDPQLVASGAAEAFRRAYGGAYVSVPASRYVGTAGGTECVRWTQVVLYPITDADGRAVSVVCIQEDVTAQREAETALRESEARLRALVEHSSDIIAILEPDGRVRYASPAQARLLGYAPDEFPVLVAYDLLHPNDVALARRRLAGVAGPAGDTSGERPLRVRRRDGAYRSFLVRVRDMRGDPAVRGIVVNAHDVTEELRLQDRLAQAQKLEALGQLAGGVAHDFNNILAAITSYGQLLHDALPPGGREAEDAAEIVRAAARGAAVTGQLLAFSRRQALETEVIELGAVVRDTARMLRPLLPSSITLCLPLPGEAVAHVRAARAQIEQIVLNLAVNARDAMPDGGVVDVRVGARTRPDGADALLIVADTGVGMSPAVRARAFEPFFTTKPAGRGTGLGLATVYGLVRQFGGTVEVESAEGTGTTFTVALPLARPPVPRAAERAERTSAAPRGARLLLAEDEEQVRTSLVRALGRAGHTVVAVPDGQAALDLLRAGEPVDLVLSDVAMPRLGGRELAAAVARERPSVRVVLMSGYAELDGAAPSPAEVAGFVAKPFEVARLLQLVDELLHGAVV